MKHIEFIIHPDEVEDVKRLLNEHNASYNKIELFSTASDIFIFSLQQVPWVAVAAIVRAYINAKASRKVVLTFPNNLHIELTGMSQQEIEKIVNDQKQWSLHLYDKKHEEQNEKEL